MFCFGKCFFLLLKIVDTVFAHRVSREFTFREFDAIVQKEWVPIIAALRYNNWFEKLTIENTKLVRCFSSKKNINFKFLIFIRQTKILMNFV